MVICWRTLISVSHFNFQFGIFTSLTYEMRNFVGISAEVVTLLSIPGVGEVGENWTEAPWVSYWICGFFIGKFIMNTELTSVIIHSGWGTLKHLWWFTWVFSEKFCCRNFLSHLLISFHGWLWRTHTKPNLFQLLLLVLWKLTNLINFFLSLSLCILLRWIKN